MNVVLPIAELDQEGVIIPSESQNSSKTFQVAQNSFTTCLSSYSWKILINNFI